MINEDDKQEDKPCTYEDDLNEFREVMPLLKNAIVQRVLTDISTDFNCLYILTDKGAFLFQCRLQGEIVGVFKEDEIVVDRFYDFELFEQFVGKRIENIRMIGAPWNGHGYVIGFAGIYDRMLVESIYSNAGEHPYRFDDCLRLGIRHYSCQDHYYWQNKAYLTGKTYCATNDNFGSKLDFIALNNLAMLLKRARAESDFSTHEIARRADTTPEAIEKIENHPEEVSLSVLENYVKAIRKEMFFAIPCKP